MLNVLEVFKGGDDPTVSEAKRNSGHHVLCQERKRRKYLADDILLCMRSDASKVSRRKRDRLSRAQMGEMSLSYKQQSSNSRELDCLSPFTGEENRTSKTPVIIRQESTGGPPQVKPDASVGCFVSRSHTWAGALQTGTGSQGAESFVSLLTAVHSKVPWPEPTTYVLHLLRTVEQMVLSVVAIGERGRHQGTHAYGERRKSRWLRRRGLHVAHTVLARAVHVHGARAVCWKSLR